MGSWTEGSGGPAAPKERQPVDVNGTMLFWLGTAARECREGSGRMQVHIAAAMSTDQSRINRFENARSWPRDVDDVIAAYADEAGCEPHEIWQRAINLWRGR
jgi:hypothetical protein